MGMYTKIYLDYEERNRINTGLKELITFVGMSLYPWKIEDDFGISNEKSAEFFYKYGIEIINSKLHKTNKTAMKSLIYASKAKVLADFDSKCGKYVWRIHKTKAKKIFQKIYEIITYSPYSSCPYTSDKEQLTETLINVYNSIFKQDKAIKQKGSQIVGYPYYPEIVHVLGTRKSGYKPDDGYTEQDIKTLNSVKPAIELFDRFKK